MNKKSTSIKDSNSEQKWLNFDSSNSDCTETLNIQTANLKPKELSDCNQPALLEVTINNNLPTSPQKPQNSTLDTINSKIALAVKFFRVWSNLLFWQKNNFSHKGLTFYLGQISGTLLKLRHLSTQIFFNCIAPKSTLRALQESEKRYRQIVETTTEGIWILNSEGNTTFVNPQLAQMLGYTEQEMLGKSFFEYLDSADRKQAEDYLQNCRSNRQTVSLNFPKNTCHPHPQKNSQRWKQDFKFYRKDGLELWAIISSNCIFDVDEKSSGILVMLTDITERKADIVALQYQTERERLMVAIQTRIRQSLNLNEILNTTVAEVRQFLGTDRVLIFKFEPNWSGIVTVESADKQWIPLLGTIVYDPCFPENYTEAYRQGRVRAIENIETAGLTKCHMDLLVQFQVKANLIVPILQGDKLWGLLIAHHCHATRHWQPLEINLLSSLATQLGIAIKQSELYQQVQSLNLELEKQVLSRTGELQEALEFAAVLKHISDRLRETLDESQILQTAVEQLVGALKVDYCCAALYNTEGTHATIRYESTSAENLSTNGTQTLETQTDSNLCAIAHKNYHYPQTAEHATTQESNSPANNNQNCKKFSHTNVSTMLDTFVASRLTEICPPVDDSGNLNLSPMGDKIEKITENPTPANPLQTHLGMECAHPKLTALGQVISMADIKSIHAKLLKGEYFVSQLTTRTNLFNSASQGELACPDLIPTPSAKLLCPIFDAQGAIGYLAVLNFKSRIFKDTEIHLSQQVASQCAIAVRQARLYQASQTQIEELQKLSRLKDDFLSTVSHELRTPMSNMRLAIQMLEIGHKQLGTLITDPPPSTKKQNPKSKITNYLQILHDECEREISLINDLLDLQRLDAGVKHLEITSINLYEWIPLVVRPFYERTGNRQQQLEIYLSPDLPPLMSDRSCVERILAELLNNACKYTPPSEHITVTVGLGLATIQLKVINSGVEIPATELHHIFEKFYRVESVDPWKQGGTGLGLALVQKLIDHLGGTIQVESASHQTSFTVELPWVETSSE